MMSSSDKKNNSIVNRQDLSSKSLNSEMDTSISLAVSEDSPNDTEAKLAREETRALFRLRMAVLFILVASTIGVACVVHAYIQNTEETRFNDQFQNDVFKVFEAVGSTLDKSLGAFDTLSVTLVSSARALNQPWPFVSLPDFAMHVAKILPQSKALYIQISPLVTPANRLEYEYFAAENDEWVDETIAIQENWINYYGPTIPNWTANEVIFGDFEDMPYNLTRPYLPIWQSFPVPPYPTWPYNWDWLSQEYPESIYACMNNRRTVISEAYMIPDPNRPGSFEEEQAWAEFYESYIPEDEEAMEPASDLFYPIIDQLDQVDTSIAKHYDPTEHKIVGMIAATIYWRALIKDILPAQSNGLVMVFSNPCNLPFTYQINGPIVEYLGVGDLHDEKYDDWGIQSELKDLNSFSEHGSEYTGARLDSYCPFTLTLYPSDTMEDKYMTAHPAIFTAVAVMIFVFTSMVFLLYDYMVERRQRIVMKTAVRSSAIVFSLFPKTVRDKIYPNSDSGDEPKKSRGRKFSANGTEPKTNLAVSPIAELYPETTVLFCDIAGFTAWSASRQPGEVFHLLETVYGEFDAIAHQRKVFKVETIGDCYMAVVGLPTPRKNHATVMARFARDCRVRMQEVTVELAETMGEDTARLGLRFGLNSGPTTAGVLRGEKGRFQLFGDTVNTASRMEHHGQVHRIQVSQSTADLLRADGKAHWLTPRLDLVHAKGKGDMQTYWCEPMVSGEESIHNSEDQTYFPPPQDLQVPTEETKGEEEEEEEDVSVVHVVESPNNEEDMTITNTAIPTDKFRTSEQRLSF